jgi:hypothetical protein
MAAAAALAGRLNALARLRMVGQGWRQAPGAVPTKPGELQRGGGGSLPPGRGYLSAPEGSLSGEQTPRSGRRFAAAH